MDDDGVIVLSDDCSDDCNSFRKTTSDQNDDCSILRDKPENDFSVSNFPVVRFSEINCRPSSKKNSEDEELDNLHLSGLTFDKNNDFRNRKRLTESSNFEKSSPSKRKSQKLSEDSCDVLQNLVTDSLQEKEWSNFDLPELNTENNNGFSKQTNDRNKSDSDSDYESQYTAIVNVNYEKYIESSDEKDKSDDNEKVKKKTVRKRKNKVPTTDADKGLAKPTKKRGPKPASKTNPKNCLKMIEVILDSEISSYDFFDDFSKSAGENEIQYSLKTQLLPKSITWKRKIEEDDDEDASSTNTRIVDENQLVIIWDCEETVKHVSEGTFVSTISRIKELMPSKKISLVIYKIQSYFKYIKSAKGQADTNKQNKGKGKTGKGFSSYPRITKKQFDECLVEAQLLYKANSRLIENPEDMVVLIQQYTKSLASLPSKVQQDEKLSEIDWCISVDNKDSVKIDKDGNGLIRLWQQQLCQFAQTSLETSEAIATVYKSPLQLMEAYAKCTQAEGELLLKDIPIRRNAGILTSSKKIGPELSKKLYIMFTSTDGDTYLNSNES